MGWMYGRGTNKEGGVGIGEEEEEEEAAARINIKKNGGAAVVKNDVGPATVGKEGIGALMSPKARTKTAKTVHAAFSSTFGFTEIGLSLFPRLRDSPPAPRGEYRNLGKKL